MKERTTLNKRPTIKDVAKKAGVSHPTVSRAIHGKPGASEKTRRRILKAMESLGYQPDFVARSLVQSKSHVLAIITPDLNPHVQPILRGIADACNRNGYAVMLFSTDYWAEEDVSYMWVARNWRVDGLLVYNVLHQSLQGKDVKSLLRDKAPLVFINKYVRDKDVDTVGVDNFDAVLQAVTHLASLGHERIGIMNGNMRSVDGVERDQAFKEALSTLGLSYVAELAAEGQFGEEIARQEMLRILSSVRRPPTAMFCANDRMAIGVIRAMKERRLKAPQDIAIVGFDDIEAGWYHTPALSTLNPPLRRVGEEAVELMVRRLRQPDRPHEQIGLKAELIIRNSSKARRRS